jgi:hypothetical protein
MHVQMDKKLKQMFWPWHMHVVWDEY